MHAPHARVASTTAHGGPSAQGSPARHTAQHGPSSQAVTRVRAVWGRPLAHAALRPPPTRARSRNSHVTVYRALTSSSALPHASTSVAGGRDSMPQPAAAAAAPLPSVRPSLSRSRRSVERPVGRLDRRRTRWRRAGRTPVRRPVLRPPRRASVCDTSKKSPGRELRQHVLLGGLEARADHGAHEPLSPADRARRAQRARAPPTAWPCAVALPSPGRRRLDHKGWERRP